MIDQRQMASLLRFLQGAYSTFEVREPTVESWLVVLGQFEYEDIFRAVHELASTGGQWSPSPGDVAERVRSYTPAVGASDVLALPEAEPADGRDLLRLARNGHPLSYADEMRLFKFVVPKHLRTGRFSGSDRDDWAEVSRNYGDLWDRGILKGGSSMKSAPPVTHTVEDVPL